MASADYTKVESYLAVKYGITKAGNYVKSDAGVIWDATANSAYHNNVGGVGRDDGSGLYQKQSSSSNGGNQLIIGAGSTLANTNALNTNTLLDGQFLIWGDNGLNKALSVPFNIPGAIGGATNYRFASIWKVQNTGSVGSVTIAWPAGIQNFQLVRSTDETFTASDEFIPMTTIINVNGVDYATATITLNDGDYFTLAGWQCTPGGILADMKIWLRADDGFSPSQWADMSGSNNSYTQTNTSRQPTLIAGDASTNFNPTVDFGGTGSNAKFMVLPDGKPYSADGTNSSIFMMIKKKNANTAYRDYLGFGGTTTGTILPQANNPVFTGTTGDRIRLYPYLEASPVQYFTADNKHHLADVSYTVGVAPIKYGLDGLDGTQSSAFAAANSLMASGSVLGAQVEESEAYIQEVIAFERDLTAYEKQKIRSYLGIKYGITLEQPQNYISSLDSVVWNASLDTTYNHNIFGLANDYITCFEQKVSNTVNNNSILTIATDNDFSSPNDGSRTPFTSDQQYTLVGDNNIDTGVISLDTPTCPLIIPGIKQLNRVWFVQRTNDTGSLYLQFDLSNYTLSSDIQLMVASDEDFTQDVSLVPAMSFSGGKAVFKYAFPDNVYFTIIGNETVPECTACTNGLQILKSGRIWFDGGSTAMTNNYINNVSLTGDAPGSGALLADVHVNYPTGIEYVPNYFPLWVGNWALLNRYDNVNGNAGKVTYSVNTKDASGSISTKPSFKISGIMKFAGKSATVKVMGYCGGTPVKPKLSYAYNSTPYLNNLLRTFNINDATSTATAIKIGGYLAPSSTLNVTFEKIVDSIAIEWTQTCDYNFKTISYMYISDMTFTCNNEPEPTPDNVSIIASYDADSLLTCQEATLKLQFNNNNCDNKTIDVTNTLPSDLEYIPDSYTAINSESATYAGQNFTLSNLELVPGNSYAYIKVKPTNTSASGTYSTHFNFTVQGGINSPNPYQSDDNSGASGYQETSIAYTASSLVSLPDFNVVASNLVSLDTTYLPVTTGSGDTIVYTYSFNNTSGAVLNNLELLDQITDSAYYVNGSIEASTGVSYLNVNDYGNTNEEKLFHIQGLELPIGTSTISVKAIARTSSDTINSSVILSVSSNDPCTSGKIDQRETSVTPACFRDGYLIPIDSVYSQLLPDNCMDNDWIYYLDDDSRVVIAIRPNGTAWSPDHITINTEAFANHKTNGTDSSVILQRLFTIKHSAVISNPVDVRLYYSQAEINAQVPVSKYPTQGWFKHSGEKANVEADLYATGLSGSNAIELTPDVTGVEFGIDYVQFNGITSFSTFGYTGNTGSTVLPIKLLYFNADKSNSSVILNWATSMEVNNKGFFVEHSLNSSDWNELGFVRSKAMNGNSNGKLEYSFIDESPNEGVNFYRLRQTDHDGKYEYSIIRQISFEFGSVISILPNPTKELIAINGLNGKEHIEICDMSGRALIKMNATGKSATISLGNLASGSYQIRIYNENKILLSKKIVKL